MIHEELVRQLRSANGWIDEVKLCLEAADVIEQLESEVEKLNKENFWLSKR